PDAIPLALEPGGRITLPPAAVDALAERRDVGIWVVDATQQAHHVMFELCALLRSHLGEMGPDARGAFAERCRPPGSQ
ncbi:MAG: hypothetical protein AAGC55_23290, partial [Myxococcota bacterium]